jgi:serine protease Do
LRVELVCGRAQFRLRRGATLVPATALALLGTLVTAAVAASADSVPPVAAAVPDAAQAAAGLLLAPRAFRRAMESVLPSVVRIETSGGILTPPPAPRPKPAPSPPGAKPSPRRPQPRGMRGLSGPGEGPTTGLIISPDGYIITSTYNFLRRPAVITVVLNDGTQHVAKLLGRDETRKLCLLKIDDVQNLPVPRTVPASHLRIGQWAITVGVGYGGDEAALSAGIVSALARVSGKAVQTDTNISPANYGGPLVDLDGRVIGICVPLSPMSEETAAGVEWYDSGIGFGVPLDGLDRILHEMKEGKTIQPGKLGVTVQPDPSGKDAIITTVADSSPAAKAGLQPKDVITAVNGQPVVDVRKLRSILGRYVAGEKIKVAVKRGEQTLEVEATLVPGVDIPAPRPAPPVDFKPDPR